MLADRSYDDELRRYIVAQEAESVIPGRRNRTVPIDYDRILYRERNIVERSIGWLKQSRRIATRYEKTAASYLGFVLFAAACHWLRNANYRKGTAVYTHRPATPRLRIGLAHSANETDGGRDDIDFDAYIIRIADADGDVVPEGDDMATMETNYGLGRNSQSDTTQETLNKLFVHDMQFPNYPTFSATGTIIRNADGSALDYATNFVFVAGTHWDSGITLTNMRVVDGFRINVGAHDLPENVLDREAPRKVTPASISIVKVGTTGDGESEYRDPGQLFAHPPDEHRDFPADTLQSDETYTITAWAVNEDDEVISPVATLKLHLLNRMVTLSATTVFQDYLNTTAVNTGTLIVTQFTVLK
ncbi:MAG: transposase [Caldilineaceae bacterium]|nr:transposase [Caldilineaceae bacterium]